MLEIPVREAGLHGPSNKSDDKQYYNPRRNVGELINNKTLPLKVENHLDVMGKVCAYNVVNSTGDLVAALDIKSDAQLIVDSVNKAQRMQEALDNIMISGNDLSTGLGISPEGDLAKKYPYTTDNQIVMDDLGYGFLYCMWICWATMMRERDKLEAEEK